MPVQIVLTRDRQTVGLTCALFAGSILLGYVLKVIDTKAWWSVSQVVLMSATLDSDLFARYFGNCAVLAAGGRTFPVQHHFLEVQPCQHRGVWAPCVPCILRATECSVTLSTQVPRQDGY